MKVLELRSRVLKLFLDSQLVKFRSFKIATSCITFIKVKTIVFRRYSGGSQGFLKAFEGHEATKLSFKVGWSFISTINRHF